jgi:molybdopterin-binding protein
METKLKNHIIYTMKFIIPMVIILGLFIGGISKGVITFKKPEIATGTVKATIKIDFNDGTIYTKTITMVNSTAYDFLMKINKTDDILVKATYWEQYDSYFIDSITFKDKKYEGNINNYWALYLNSQPAMQGSNKIYVENEDIIEYRYEKF